MLVWFELVRVCSWTCHKDRVVGVPLKHRFCELELLIPVGELEPPVSRGPDTAKIYELHTVLEQILANREHVFPLPCLIRKRSYIIAKRQRARETQALTSESSGRLSDSPLPSHLLRIQHAGEIESRTAQIGSATDGQRSPSDDTN